MCPVANQSDTVIQYNQPCPQFLNFSACMLGIILRLATREIVCTVITDCARVSPLSLYSERSISS